MKTKILLCCCLLFFKSASSQVATLYAGLSGVVGKKGDVNIEVLTEIITDKQEELKKEFARRTLLSSVQNGSFAFYAFADNSFNTLFNTTNRTAASRKLIEASANLALAYGFTEFYLLASKRLLRNEDLADVFIHATPDMLDSLERRKWLLFLSVDENTLEGNHFGYYPAPANFTPDIGFLESTFSEYDRNKKQYLFASDSLTVSKIISCVNNNNIYNEMLIKHQDWMSFIYKQYNHIQPGFNVNNYMLDQLKPSPASLTKKQNEPVTSLNFILTDMVYDILLKSEQMGNLGFFTSENTMDRTYYEANNKYLSFIRNNPSIPVTAALKKLYKRVEGEITLLFKTYTLLKDISQKELSIADMDTIYKVYNNRGAMMRACSNLLSLQDSLMKYSPGFKGNYNLDSVAHEVDQLFQRLKLYQLKSSSVEKKLIDEEEDLFSNQDLLFITREAYPALTKLSFIIGANSSYFSSLDTVYRYVLYQNIVYLKKEISKFNPALLYRKMESFTDFVELLNNLNDLDRASSYESVLKVIENAGAMYSNMVNVKTFNTLANSIEKYTIIDTKENRIYVDVESIILAIYNKFANRENYRFNFYFSVGLNQSLNIEPDFKYIASDTLNSLGYVAEKIGFKFKVLDFKQIRSYEIGENAPVIFGVKKRVTKVKSRTPIVSDFHVIGYGSGLLYNIVSTKTSAQFTSYLLGYGLGVSFYNGLDLNFTINYPIGVNESLGDVLSPDNSYRMFAVSLDIKIGEYLTALSQKNKK